VSVSESGDDKVTFGQSRSFEFDPDNSCESCLETDSLMTLNVPYVTILSSLMNSLQSPDLLREMEEMTKAGGEYADSLFIIKVLINKCGGRIQGL